MAIESDLCPKGIEKLGERFAIMFNHLSEGPCCIYSLVLLIVRSYNRIEVIIHSK